MYSVSEERFEEMVNDALDQVPDEFVRKMRNLVMADSKDRGNT